MLLFSKRSTEARKRRRKEKYADDDVDESRAYQRQEVETEAEGLGTATGTDGAREDGRYERRQRRRPGPHRDGGGAAGHDFVELGVHPAVVASLASLGITIPTPVQRHCLPHAMRGSDVVAIATTGSGKTAAFAVPIVDALIAEPFGGAHHVPHTIWILRCVHAACAVVYPSLSLCSYSRPWAHTLPLRTQSWPWCWSRRGSSPCRCTISLSRLPMAPGWLPSGASCAAADMTWAACASR